MPHSQLVQQEGCVTLQPILHWARTCSSLCSSCCRLSTSCSSCTGSSLPEIRFTSSTAAAPPMTASRKAMMADRYSECAGSANRWRF